MNLFKNLERKDKIKIIATFFICLGLIIGTLIPRYVVRQIGLGEVIPTVDKETKSPYGTPFYYIQYFMKDDKDFAKIYSHYYETVYEFHGDSDRYYYYNDINGNSKNNLRTINESYGSNQEIVVSNDLFNVLKMGIEFTKLTDGKFNILIGELSSFWNDSIKYLKENYDTSYDPLYNKESYERIEFLTSCVPTVDEIDSVLVLNEEKHSVKFNEYVNADGEVCSKKDISISLGGIAKGYSNDLLSKRLIENGFTTGAIYGGGSSITTLGNLPNRKSWLIPAISEENLFFKIDKKGAFNFSLSGSYEGMRVYDENSGEYVLRHHIIDPITGYPKGDYVLTSVVSEDMSSAYCDALTTALLNMSYEEGLALVKSLKEHYNLEVLWAYKGSESVIVQATNGFYDLIEKAEGVEYRYEDGTKA